MNEGNTIVTVITTHCVWV